MRDFRPNYRTNRTSTVVRVAFFAACCQITLFSINGLALEEESSSPTDAELGEAFRLGYGGNQDSTDEGELVVLRFGPTFVFREGKINSEEPMELTCILCTTDEALSLARSFGAELGSIAQNMDPSTVDFGGTLFEGSIEIDGVPLAPATGSHLVEPGTHTVVKTVKGVRSRAEVELEPGETVDLASLEMESVSWKVRPTVALIGLGITAALLGGIFLWLDGECATTNVDLQGDCEKQHDLKGGGWALIGIGAAIDVGALVWLLWPEGQQSSVRGETK